MVGNIGNNEKKQIMWLVTKWKVRKNLIQQIKRKENSFCWFIFRDLLKYICWIVFIRKLIENTTKIKVTLLHGPHFKFNKLCHPTEIEIVKCWNKKLEKQNKIITPKLLLKICHRDIEYLLFNMKLKCICKHIIGAL